MPAEPAAKRAIAFFDGQNLFYAAKYAFGYSWPNYDPREPAISIQQNRWIKLACAFPVSPTYTNTRGINKTDWFRIDRATYDACDDPRDYRPKGTP